MLTNKNLSILKNKKRSRHGNKQLVDKLKVTTLISVLMSLKATIVSRK